MGKGSEQVAPRAFSTDTGLGETPRLMSGEDSRAHEPSRISMGRILCVVATDALRGSQAIHGQDARYIDHALPRRRDVCGSRAPTFALFRPRRDEREWRKCIARCMLTGFRQS